MNINKKILSGMFLVFVILFLGLVSATYMRSDTQTSQFNVFSYQSLDESLCQDGQDFIIQIAPFGCTPAVVRSDLLEENDVPIFCQLGATKINPLIEVEAIDSISFSGEYPPEVSGIGFHPAKSALGVEGNLNTPVLANIGYVVINLRKQPNASAMPDSVSGTLTANIKYDINNAFGVGKALFYLPEISSEDEWDERKSQYSFWSGKGNVRAEEIGIKDAEISVYSNNRKISSVRLEEGETSNSIYLPGFDCQAGLKLKLEDLESPDTRAKLRVNAEIVEVAKGERFLDNKCLVTELEKKGIVQTVNLRCSEDDGANSFSLIISPRILLEVNGNELEADIGDWLYDEGDRGVYLGYVGVDEDSTGKENLFVYLISMPEKKSKLNDAEISSINSLVGDLIISGETSSGVIDDISDVLNQFAGLSNQLYRYIGKGEEFHRVNLEDKDQKVFGQQFSIVGFADAQDIELTGKAKENYENAKNDYDAIRKAYPSEAYTGNSDSTFGEEALYKEIILASDAHQKATVSDFCNEFMQDYPTSNKDINNYCTGRRLSNTDVENVYVNVNGKVRKISFDGIYEPSFEDFGARVIVETPEGIKVFYMGKNKISYLNTGVSIFRTLVSNVVSIDSLYFKYENNNWLWSFDDKYWMGSSTLRVVGGARDGDEPNDKSKELIFSLNGKTADQGEQILLNANAKKEEMPDDFLQLVSLNDNSARVRTSINDEFLADIILKEFNSNIIDLTKDIPKTLGDYTFTLTDINLKKLVKVSVLPNINNAGTQANFSFSVGIEKRAFDLPPERIKETISELNEQIGRWQNISASLEKVIGGLKTGCLVTGGILTIKNFASNLRGKGIARQEVMRGSGGWYERCADLVSEGEYSSQERCYLDNSNEIDNDVDTLSEIISEQNSEIKDLEQGITERQFLGEKVVDTEKFAEKYAPQVSNYLDENLGDSFADPSGVGETVNKDEILTILSSDYSEGRYNIEQLRNIELYSTVLNDPDASEELKEIADKRLYSELLDIKTASQNYAQVSNWAGDIGVSPEYVSSLETGGDVKKLTYDGLTNSDIGSKIVSEDSNAPISLVQTFPDGEQYILVLDDSAGTSQLPIKNLGDGQLAIYDSAGNLVQDPPIELKNVYFQKYDSSSYQNNYKNAELRCYETEPYKGLPAIVPFDLKGGWYAAMKQTLAVGSNIETYDASARVNSFYLCNVGQNGLEEFQTIGDDTCQQINLGTGMSYDQFPGLDADEASKKIEEAIQAIEQGSRLCSQGVSGIVSILGENVQVGSPAVDVPDYECQDFMSPKECLLLFNLCDPVACPSSRCDLGGAYPVQDVVQSGIIGSIALCLPNIKDGIIMPVCLTGIKAGIDGFLSVKESYRDCLQESLDTGQLVGLCDEVYSLYICDFFWRQALPLAQIALPKMFEFIAGQNVRGGGEYLSVQNSFDTAQNSADYLAQSYGTNIFAAFKSGAVQGIGGEFCKAYASGVYPEGGDLISSLTEADSPVQFHGRFDEIPFSSVTVPPTSHYKVFYHIYAGKNSGAYYKVYLRGSASSYYQDTSQSISVASGYIAVGGYASETKDFTAPSGYKELCINVNGQEECGFQEISTSFAINYLEDKYLESQATETDIQGEAECVSGTASSYSFLNPNVQSAGEELINPQIYNEGITRICATDNPGKGTDPYAGTEQSRWVEVGYCDDKAIKCWLDTQSVENVITNTDIEEAAIEDVSGNYLDILRNEGGYLSEEEFSSAVEEIESDEPENKIEIINEIFEKVFWNNEKAQLLYLRGNAYADLFRNVLPTIKPEEKEIVNVEDEIITRGISSEKESPDEEIEPVEDKNLPGYRVWEIAMTYAEGEYNHFIWGDSFRKIYENVCTSFVTKVLVEAGAFSHQETFIPTLIPQLEASDEYIEVYSYELEKGDVVIFSKHYSDRDGGSKNTQHITIFSHYDDETKKKYINAYGDPSIESPVVLEHRSVKEGLSSLGFYRGFRYVGENYVKPARTKWTIDSAIEKVDLILRDDDYEGGKTTYSSGDEIKRFVNELCEDAVLPSSECKFKNQERAFRTRFRKDEKTMEELKLILLEEKASSGQEETIIAD